MESRSTEQQISFPEIREVNASRALTWLALGWADLRATPWQSLFYGFCFAVMGIILSLVFRFAIDYTSTLAMGFMLLGPILAIGLYDLSRQRERIGHVDFRKSLVAWRNNTGGIGVYVLILVIVYLVWARASLVSFALFDSRAMPTWSSFAAQLTEMKSLPFLLVFFGVGLFFAMLVFAFSAVSIPFLLDRRSDAITAAAVSVVCLVKNPLAMFFWATMIVLLIGLGFATAYIGLLVTGPLVGHATWHAYRDLVVEPSDLQVLP